MQDDASPEQPAEKDGKSPSGNASKVSAPAPSSAASQPTPQPDEAKRKKFPWGNGAASAPSSGVGGKVSSDASAKATSSKTPSSAGKGKGAASGVFAKVFSRGSKANPAATASKANPAATARTNSAATARSSLTGLSVVLMAVVLFLGFLSTPFWLPELEEYYGELGLLDDTEGHTAQYQSPDDNDDDRKDEKDDSRKPSDDKDDSRKPSDDKDKSPNEDDLRKPSDDNEPQTLKALQDRTVALQRRLRVLTQRIDAETAQRDQSLQQASDSATQTIDEVRSEVNAVFTVLERTRRDWSEFLAQTLARIQSEAISSDEIIRAQQRGMLTRIDAHTARLAEVERALIALDTRLVDLKENGQTRALDERLWRFVLLEDIRARITSGARWDDHLSAFRATFTDAAGTAPNGGQAVELQEGWEGWQSLAILERDASEGVYALDALVEEYHQAQQQAVLYEALQCATGWWDRWKIQWRAIIQITPPARLDADDADRRSGLETQGQRVCALHASDGNQANRVALVIEVGRLLTRGDHAQAVRLLSSSTVGADDHPLHAWYQEFTRTLMVIDRVNTLQRQTFSFPPFPRPPQ